jgi:hypothetical protein
MPTWHLTLPARFAALTAVLTACSHTAPFTGSGSQQLGPFGTGTDVQLTLNVGEDYWPAYTEDGQGILYQYTLGDTTEDRCVGLLPAAGGTRLWQLCDARSTQTDSVNSFSAYALGGDGRLLYLEATSPPHAESFRNVALWLADSAQPFQRRLLATFPMVVGDSIVDWLSDARWTGPSTFAALAQRLTAEPHCRFCTADDTIFTGLYVVTGTITSAGANLSEVPGTTGATEFGLSASRGTIVFSRAGDLNLWEISAGGGTAASVATIPSAPGRTVLGLSCAAAICVATTGRISGGGGVPVTADSGRLWSIDLIGQAVSQIAEPSENTAWSSSVLSPDGHDVVLQQGGAPGNQRLISDPGSDLHLLKQIVP